MANQFTDTTFAVTYKDDFADSDNYHRVLFNSGRALQARELTQLQTIIQAEIERFGSHVFKEGAQVRPGGLSLDTAEYVKLEGTPSNLADFAVGQELTETGTGIKAIITRIEQYVDASNPATFYVKYTDRSGGTAGATAIRFTNGAAITNGDGDSVTVQVTNTTENPAVGNGTLLSISEGDFYARGHFVQCNAQTIVVSRYSSTPSVNVGFKTIEDIVTVDDTTALYDNQNVLPNETAPGADRYRIRLILTDEDSVASDENFIFLNRLVNGEFAREIERTTYNIIGNESAKRTFEESGNYIVENFDMQFREDADSDTKLVADVGPGIAYVNGYRFGRTSLSPLEVNKARTTDTINNDVSAATFGNYIVVDGSTMLGVPNIDTFEQINLRDSADYLGSTIGTARVRQVEANGSNYNYYLFDVQMNSGQKFTDVRSIGTGVTAVGNTVLDNNNTVLNDVDNNNVFFTMSHTRPKNLTDISLTVQRRFTATLDGSGVDTLTLTASGETFASTGSWIISRDSDGAIINADSITGSGTAAATITHAASANQTIEILALVNKAAGQVRAKTATNTTVTATIDSDGNGLQFIPLGKADVYNVERVAIADSDGADLAEFFTLDDGQRDNFYEDARLILNRGLSAPAGNVFARFNYFAHDASGDFFAVNSYIGQVDYENIPTYTLKDGQTINLRDVLDFRSRKGDGNTEFNTATGRVNELPLNTDLVQADIEYYLPRQDIIVAVVNQPDQTDEGFKYIEGVPAFNPVPPTAPTNSMLAYSILLNAYTDNEDDLSFIREGNRRYTMEDIGILEERIARVEETTTLNLLELETANIEVLDENGLNRFKNGFFADNFATLDFVDVDTGEFIATIDEDEDTIKPLVNVESVGLQLDSAASTNIQVAGEFIMLPYQDSAVSSVTVASGTENLNPYNIVGQVGTIELSPSADNFSRINVQRTSRTIQQGRAFANNRLGLARPVGRWSGGGNENARVGGPGPAGATTVRQRFERTMRARAAFNAQLLANGVITRAQFDASGAGFYINNPPRPGSTQRARTVLPANPSNFQTVSVTRRGRTTTTVRESITLADFIRSRLVFFRASGLRPNSRHFAFFDGQSVDSFVRAESTFEQFINRDDEIDQPANRNATAHPNGATNLVSNDKGEIIGSFFIPDQTFAVGDREFKLIDVSVNDEDAALSYASSNFSGSGTFTTRLTSTVTVARPRPRRRRGRGRRTDPLAQSFYTPMDDTGGFITKIDVFFQSRPSENIPVRCQIRPMVDGGHPSENFIGQTFVNRDDVVIPGDLTDLATIRANPTTFTFAEPVYMQPGTEYAFVLIADTDDYNVFVSQTGAFEIGTTERRIARQPTLGSLFMSQNNRTWTPDQTRDMMHTLYAASFDTSVTGTAKIVNRPVRDELLSENPFHTDSGSSTVFVRYPSSGLVSGDVIAIGGVDSSADVGGITGTSLLGDRTVVDVDLTGFTFVADSAATSNAIAGGSTATSTQNIMFDAFTASFDMFDDANTTTSMTANFIKGVSMSTVNDVANAAYDASTVTTPFVNNEKVYLDTPSMIAGQKTEVANLGVGKSADVTVTMSTSNKWLSPVLDMQTAAFAVESNIIDNQVDSAGLETSLTNVPILYVDETNTINGTAAAKHVTETIALAEPAVGLKVIIGAHRPSNSFIDVYYKLAAAGNETQINDLDWTLVEEETNNPTDDGRDVFRNYEYLVGGQTGTLEPFSAYKIKVVMRSANSSKTPRLRDIRGIALGT